jgi:hypothetical protein
VQRAPECVLTSSEWVARSDGGTSQACGTNNSTTTTPSAVRQRSPLCVFVLDGAHGRTDPAGRSAGRAVCGLCTRPVPVSACCLTAAWRCLAGFSSSLVMTDSRDEDSTRSSAGQTQDAGPAHAVNRVAGGTTWHSKAAAPLFVWFLFCATLCALTVCCLLLQLCTRARATGDCHPLQATTGNSREQQWRRKSQRPLCTRRSLRKRRTQC